MQVARNDRGIGFLGRVRPNWKNSSINNNKNKKNTMSSNMRSVPGPKIVKNVKT